MKAGEVDEAEEVFDVVFPTGDESAEVVHPGEEPLHFPASAIAAQFASILGRAFATAPVRCDQFDAIFGGELFIKRVRVVGFVADELAREFVKKASGKNLFHKPALGSQSVARTAGSRSGTARRASSNTGSTNFYCSSVHSQRSAISSCGDTQTTGERTPPSNGGVVR